MKPLLSRAGDPPDGHQVLVRRAVPLQPLDHPARGARDPRDLQQPPRHAQEALEQQPHRRRNHGALEALFRFILRGSKEIMCTLLANNVVKGCVKRGLNQATFG